MVDWIEVGVQNQRWLQNFGFSEWLNGGAIYTGMWQIEGGTGLEWGEIKSSALVKLSLSCLLDIQGKIYQAALNSWKSVKWDINFEVFSI